MWALNEQQTPKAPPSPGQHNEASEDEERPLRCAACEHEVSSTDAAFVAAHGGATGHYLNPHGLFREIVTLRWARVLPVTPPTEADTWFSGYAWEAAICEACGAHLGWRFTATRGAQPAVFYGLLTAALQNH